MRREILNKPKRIVIKLGSAVVTNPGGGVNQEKISEITKDIAQLMKDGIQVVLISSGAIAAARGNIKFQTPKESIEHLQALSAVGQPMLMEAYSKALRSAGLCCAQVLLTHEDFKNKNRYLNARNTLETLLKENVVPILNENDSVSFTEITVGDNDQLAAMSAQALAVDLMLLLSGPDGLYAGENAVQWVGYEQTPHRLVRKEKSNVGRGGMMTKLDAVKKATQIGIPTIIASYKFSNPISRALYQDCGTYFQANPKIKHTHREAWLITTVKPGVFISIDDGAYTAIKKGKSLLPVGIKKIQGEFKRGDCVTVKCGRKSIGVGLIEYSSKELALILIDAQAFIKEFNFKTEAIHRNNFVLKDHV